MGRMGNSPSWRGALIDRLCVAANYTQTLNLCVTNSSITNRETFHVPSNLERVIVASKLVSMTTVWHLQYLFSNMYIFIYALIHLSIHSLRHSLVYSFMHFIMIYLCNNLTMYLVNNGFKQCIFFIHLLIYSNICFIH